jgi:hypothetical protein
MLSRDPTRTQHILQLRDAEPEDSHAERKRDGREEVEILRGFIESRRVLKDGEAACAHTH